MKLRPAPGVELVDAPVLEDELIVRRTVLRSSGHDRSVRYLDNVSLPDLVSEASLAESAGDAARAAAVPFDEAYRALDWLYRSGYLVE